MSNICLKPLDPTTLACVGRLPKKIEEFLKEIEDIEAKSGENLALMLENIKDIFSESIQDFKALDLDEKLLALTRRSLKSALVCARILNQNLRGEVTSDVENLLKKSGLICGLLA